MHYNSHHSAHHLNAERGLCVGTIRRGDNEDKLFRYCHLLRDPASQHESMGPMIPLQNTTDTARPADTLNTPPRRSEAAREGDSDSDSDESMDSSMKTLLSEVSRKVDKAKIAEQSAEEKQEIAHRSYEECNAVQSKLGNQKREEQMRKEQLERQLENSVKELSRLQQQMTDSAAETEKRKLILDETSAKLVTARSKRLRWSNLIQGITQA